MRLLLSSLSVLLFSVGCIGQIPCDDDAVCGEGGVCDVDKGVCVKDDGGDEGEGDVGEGEGDVGEGEGEGEGDVGEGEGDVGEGEGEGGCVADDDCPGFGEEEGVEIHCVDGTCRGPCGAEIVARFFAGRQSFIGDMEKVLKSPGGIDVAQEELPQGLVWVPPVGGLYLLQRKLDRFQCFVSARPLDKIHIERLIDDENDIDFGDNRLEIDPDACAFEDCDALQQAFVCGSNFLGCDNDIVVGRSVDDDVPLQHQPRFDVVGYNGPLFPPPFLSRGGASLLRIWQGGEVIEEQDRGEDDEFIVGQACTADECFPRDLQPVGCGSSCPPPTVGCDEDFDPPIAQAAPELFAGDDEPLHMCAGDVDFVTLRDDPEFLVVRTDEGTHVRVQFGVDGIPIDLFGDTLVPINSDASVVAAIVYAVDVDRDAIVEVAAVDGSALGEDCIEDIECDSAACSAGHCVERCPGAREGNTCLTGPPALCLSNRCVSDVPTLAAFVTPSVEAVLGCSNVVLRGALPLTVNAADINGNALSCDATRCAIQPNINLTANPSDVTLTVTIPGGDLVVPLFTQTVSSDPDGDGSSSEIAADSDVDGFPDCVDLPTDDTEDLDADGLSDSLERDIGLSTTLADTDGDGVNDGDEAGIPVDIVGTSLDRNHNGFPDRYELRDTDRNNEPDAFTRDEDGDGIDAPDDVCPTRRNLDLNRDTILDACPRVQP